MRILVLGNAPVRRPGFTLAEMLVVLGALTVALLVGTVTLLGVARVHHAAVESSRRMAVRAALTEQFRCDVGRAAAAPERLDDLTAGPTCLILRTPDGGHVAYQWQEGRLSRAERAAPGGALRPQPIGPGGEALAFSREGRLVTMQLSEPRGTGAPDRQVVISAALGGDLR